jgi:hypothetical protein
MTETPPRATIRLALTECQKKQIREATGREVNALELRLTSLPEPATPADQTEHRPGSPEPHDPIHPGRKP